jgi:hypothetical protein
MSELYIVAGAILYWTFAVVCIAFISDAAAREPLYIKAAAICVAVLWPLSVLIAFIAFLYRIPVASAQTIRTDLHNRKLLRKFEKWLKEQKQ